MCGAKGVDERRWKKNARDHREDPDTIEARDGGRSDDGVEVDAQDNEEGCPGVDADGNSGQCWHRWTIVAEDGVLLAGQPEED